MILDLKNSTVVCGSSDGSPDFTWQLHHAHADDLKMSQIGKRTRLLLLGDAGSGSS